MGKYLTTEMIRKHDVLRITGWSNSTLYERIAQGNFKPGVKMGKRMVAWPLHEVEDYIQARIGARDAGTKGDVQ